MSLTVPRAGITFGQSADTRVQMPDVGGEVARFGAAMSQIGKALTDERNTRAYNVAELQMLERFNGLELELSQIGDPDQLDDLFRARAPSVLDATGQVQGAPFLEGLGGDLPDELRDRLALRYEELRLGTGRSVGRQALALRQSAREAFALQARNVTLEGAVAAPSPEGAAVNADQYALIVSQLVQAGIWTPERGQRELLGWDRDRAEARATRVLSEDPEALLSGLDGQDFASLTVERRESLRAQANAAIATRGREAAEARATTRLAEDPDALLSGLDGEDFASLTVARRESLRAQATAAIAARAREAAAAHGQRLREGTRVVLSGYDYADADELATDPATADHPAGPEFLAALALHRSMPGLSRLPPAAQRQLLAQETAQPVQGGAGYEIEQRATLRAAVTASTEAWARDPLGHAAELGMIRPVDLPDPATDANNSLADSLRSRLAQAQSLAQGGYTEQPVLLRPAERAAFEAATAIGADPALRTRVASALVTAMGDDAEALMPQFSADPVFAYVGGLLNYTEDETLARQIFEGQRAIAAGDLPLPSEPMRRAIWFEQFGSLFRAFGDSPLRDQVIGSADALTAYRLRGNPASRDAEAHRTAWLQSAHEVMGGTGRFDTRTARGGVQTLNGALTIMPPGVSAADARTRLMDVSTRLVAAQSRAGPNATAEPMLRQISVGGSLPMAGSVPIDGNTLRNVIFEAAGGDAYFGYVQTGAGPMQITDDTGAPWRLDMRALLEAGP